MATSSHNSTSNTQKGNQSGEVQKQQKKDKDDKSQTSSPPEPPTPPEPKSVDIESDSDPSVELPERSTTFKQALQKLSGPEKEFLLTTENSLKKAKKEGKFSGMLKRLYKNPAEFMKWYSEHT